MDGQRPAAPARQVLDRVAMQPDAVAVGLAPGAGVADPELDPGLRLMQDRLAGKREGLLDRVDDHDEMAARAAPGDAGDDRRDGVDRRQEIADEDRLVEASD